MGDAAAGAGSDLVVAAQAPIADEALQNGHAYPKHEAWAYMNLDPSCGSLTWTYTNTIPGVTVTLNPTKTTLTGKTVVSFSKLPATTPVGAYSQTIAGMCTKPSHTGIGPGPTGYTIAAVILDVARVDQAGTGATVVTGKTFKPIVGQFIELAASPQPAVTLTPQTAGFWGTIPGDTVKSYTQTKNKAEFKTLATADLKKEKIDFYWIHGSAGANLSIALNAVFPVFFAHCAPGGCTGNEAYWGLADAKTSADVLAPSGASLTSKTGVVAADKIGSTCYVALHFGYTSTACAHPGAIPGIHWKFKATAPAGGGGDLEGTQLIDRTDTAAPLPSASPVATAYPGTIGYALDTCIHYGNNANAHEPIAGGAAATWESDDTPGFPLRDTWKTFKATDKFIIHFVYKPTDAAGAPASRMNIWVPLGKLLWNWNGTATNSGTRPAPGTELLDLPAPARNPSWLAQPPAPSVQPLVHHPVWSLTSSAHATDPSGTTANEPLPTWTSLYSPQVQACPPGG